MWQKIKEYERFDLWITQQKDGSYRKECFFKDQNPNLLVLNDRGEMIKKERSRK